MLRYPTYMAVETLTIALVTEDGQAFEDLGIEERKEGQVIIKCRKAEPMGDGAPCEWNKMGSDGYPFCASATEIMRLRDVLEAYAKTFDGWAAENNGGGRQMDGPDWLELANELRMERDGV